MESETQKIKETVIAILKDASLEEATEFKVRAMAAERLGIDLSDLEHKCLVRRVVESYLLSIDDDDKVDKVQEQTKEVVRELGTKQDVESKEAKDEKGQVICNLSRNRKVSVHEFRGKTLMSIREYQKKDAKLVPSAKGISLTAQQWSALRRSVPDIEVAVTNMELRIRTEDAGKQIGVDTANTVTAVAEGVIAVEGRQNKVDKPNSVSVSAPQDLIPVQPTGPSSVPTTAPQALFPGESGPISEERKQMEVVKPSSVSASGPQGLSPTPTAHLDRKFSEKDRPSSVNVSTPPGLVPIQISRLHGKNYHIWAQQMEFFLKQLKISYVLIEPRPSSALTPQPSLEKKGQAKGMVQKWLDDDYICYQSILNSLSDLLFEQYSNTKSAKELWEQLKLSYGDDLGAKRSLVNKYIKFRMVDGSPIFEQVEELHWIADTVVASGMQIDEYFHVTAIIFKLPPSWNECRLKWMREDFLPLHMLMHRLRVEEESRNPVKREEPLMGGFISGERGLIPERKQTEVDKPSSVSAYAPQGLSSTQRTPLAWEISETHSPCSVNVSASQGLVPIQITRLDGKNYHFWAQQMEFFLKQLKISYVLTEPRPSVTLTPQQSLEQIGQAKGMVQKWLDDDYICYHSILNSLSDHLFEQYSKTKSAKELWEQLRLSYSDGLGAKRSLVIKYLKFQMVDGIPIFKQVEELHWIADSIIASGMQIDEYFHVTAIISKLPPSWKECRKKWMREDFLPLHMLMHRLRVEEESRSNSVKREDSIIRAHVGESRAENKLGPKKDNKVLVCYSCGKKGHMSRNCQDKKAEVREKKNDENEVPVVAEAEMDVGLAE